MKQSRIKRLVSKKLSQRLTRVKDGEKRKELARELRDLLRRLDLIRAIGVASRGAAQEK